MCNLKNGGAGLPVADLCADSKGCHTRDRMIKPKIVRLPAAASRRQAFRLRRSVPRGARRGRRCDSPRRETGAEPGQGRTLPGTRGTPPSLGDLLYFCDVLCETRSRRTSSATLGCRRRRRQRSQHRKLICRS